jgi:hypothetical protein
MTEVPNSEPKYEPTDADHATAEAPKYEPTEAERAALNRQAQRQKEQSVSPRLKTFAGYGGFGIVMDHPDMTVARSLFKEALGTADDDFCDGLLSQFFDLVNMDDSCDQITEVDLNFLISMVKNGKPKDEHHTMLLFQMGGIHMVLIKMMRNYLRIQREFMLIDRDWTDKNPYLIEKRESLIKSLSLLLQETDRSVNRLARTLCMQSEALERYRRSGEPSMTVQQLTVAQQAIVGNVTHTSPQTAPNNPTTAPRALTDQQHTAMPIIGEPDRVAVPVRRRKRQ